MSHGNLMATTKQKPLIDTEKLERKESKHCTEERHQTAREDSKKKKEERGTTKATRK